MDDFLNAIDGVLEQHGKSSSSNNLGNRPSAKSIYEQRKQYAKSLSKDTSNFYHRVEHLLTCELDNDIRYVEDCLKHLHLLHAEGKVWAQEMILQVQYGELVLTDLESMDSLENIPLMNVVNCRSKMGHTPYNSILAITIQNQRNLSIMMFQCEEKPATIVHKNLDKVLIQAKENQQIHGIMRNKFQVHSVQSDANECGPSTQSSSRLAYPGKEHLQDFPILQIMSETKPVLLKPPSHTQSLDFNQPEEITRDIEVLNHVLRDIEILVGYLDSYKKKKKVSKGKAAIPESDFFDCLQKIKYAFNLLGKVQDHMFQPTATDLVHMLLHVLPKILSSCSWNDMASSVLSPFPSQKALLLLNSCVTEKERILWESLGDAWLRTRADWPNAKMIPPYIPVFSDGWIPPNISKANGQTQVQENLQPLPTHGNLQEVPIIVLYDFEARNDRELSVRKEDRVKVLDQSRQWWLVENSQGHRGFVPSNILEGTNFGQLPGQSVTQLHLSSSAEEVTAWLKNKAFSRITVRCLGVLTGGELLELSREDLKAVCPEEGGRVFTELKKIQTPLI
ncbi:epidermal growth factor receptor kinase substrate 8-like protein 3 [Pyxicephalus adspersus]|uniref:epidermal growth factor receptor kinase substrate 8-like protein 3 n=1 Tax=Pyxicephalus adspersus TaxID=30357 RepID=UPI003B594F31